MYYDLSFISLFLSGYQKSYYIHEDNLLAKLTLNELVLTLWDQVKHLLNAISLHINMHWIHSLFYTFMVTTVSGRQQTTQSLLCHCSCSGKAHLIWVEGSEINKERKIWTEIWRRGKILLSSYFKHSTVFHPNSLIWGILPRKCFNVCWYTLLTF